MWHFQVLTVPLLSSAVETDGEGPVYRTHTTLNVSISLGCVQGSCMWLIFPPAFQSCHYELASYHLRQNVQAGLLDLKMFILILQKLNLVPRFQCQQFAL